MSEGKRRSNRLIQSPWLHNWPKKPPIYINLDSGSTIEKNVARKFNTSLTCTEHNNSGKHSETRSKATARRHMDDLDVRNEWIQSKKPKCNTTDDNYQLEIAKYDKNQDPKKQGKQMNELTVFKNYGNNNDSSDDDEDFVTPAEYLVEKSKTKVAGMSSTKRRTRTTNQGVRAHVEQSAGVKDTMVIREESKNNESRTVRKKLIAEDNAGSAKITEKMKGPRKVKMQKKVPRVYNRYIQKKFSPSIMTDVIANLSAEQLEWARKTGFGELLNFRMESYTHRLGYNVVNAFNNKTCSLNVKAGIIKVDEITVKRIYGLPLGKKTIVFNAKKSSLGTWAQQFTEESSSKITPIMVRDKILGSQRVDDIFKWNFLILFYNFFVESNQNSFLKRDVLSFSGDLNKCGDYNWCKLVIDKLKKTHEYWEADPKRNFTGSLPLLIYLYACTVRNYDTVYILQTHPAYRGWSDMLLRQRQKHDIGKNCFGEGLLVELTDQPEDPKLVHHEQNVELTMSALVDRDEGRGDKVQGDDEAEEELPLHPANQSVEAGQENALKSKNMTNQCVAGEETISDTDFADGMNNNSPLLENLAAQRNEKDTEEMDLDYFDQGFHGTMEKEPCLDTNKEHYGMQYVDGAIIPLSPKKNTLMSAHEYWLKAFGPNKDLGLNDGAPLDINAKHFSERLKGKVQHTGGERITNPTEAIQHNTQARMDEEIDKHFEEEACVNRFEKNLKEFVDIYERCVTDFEVTYALYHQNTRMAELKEEYGKYIQMFAVASPIAKHLPVSVTEDTARNKTMIDEDVDYMPNYSLGISQVTPKNLELEMEGTAKTQMTGELGVSASANNRVMSLNELLVTPQANETNIITRPRRDIRCTEICRSPYVSRVVDITGHTLTTEEKNVWNWLFENKRNRRESLFQWNDKKCTKAHFQSMLYSKLVETTVIDTWTYLLNENENLRSDASPLRLFMTTETTLGPLRVNVPDGDTELAMHRDAIFCDNMDVVLASVEELHKRHYDVKDYELFLFPVYQGAHHFVICYNTKIPRWDIIDNRVPTATLEDTYGDLPSRLHACFCQWISIYNIPKYEELVKLRPRLIRTGWQTESNMVDCGIFAMRHLETYMGCLLSWKVGLRTEKENQGALLNKLRVIYANKILTWSRNANRRAILDSAAHMATSNNSLL